MATDYTTICDFCGVKVCGKSDDWPVKNSNWRVSIGNSWIDADDGCDLLTMKRNVEIDKDACFECAKKVSDVIKKILPNQ